MGKELDKLRTERRLDRSADPHAWAENLERNDTWRTLVVAFVAILVIFLGWQVFTLKRDLAELKSQIDVPCVPTPGPSGEMPPPGFC